MLNQPKEIKIVILDDSAFYNRLLTKQIENCTNSIMRENKGCTFNISAYVHSDDFLRNLDEDTDLAFIDYYYLGQGITGGDIIKKINEKCKNCNSIIVSKLRNVETTIDSISLGALAFIYKDKNALARACLYVEHIANNKPFFK